MSDSTKTIITLAIAFGCYLAGSLIANSIFGPYHSDLSALIGLACAAAAGYRAYKFFPQSEPAPPPVPTVSYPPRPVFLESDGYVHGSAAWQNPEYIDSSFNKGERSNRIDGPGFYIGEWYNVLPPMHAVCVAGSGQGKGTNLIIPNLLKTPSASWFVIDPKGENARITARWQRDAGQKVVILDPWNEQKRLGATHGIEPMGFNPLHFAKDNPDEMPEICGLIAHMLVPDVTSSKDEYWSSRARALVKTYLLHLVTAAPEEDQHLGTIYKWLRLSVEEERPKLWVDMRLNEACDGLIQDGINQFYGMSDSDGPLPSIISTAQDNTEFLSSVQLRASLTSNEFNPYDLTDGKTTVYLCLPERFIQSHARWLRLVVGICLKACNYRPNKRVNFLLDEFAILGRMTDVERAFAFARGQNVCVWIFVQSLTQLIDIYGENAANTLLSNARLRHFFGIFDLKTQQFLSEYLGDETIEVRTESRGGGVRSVSTSETSRRLMTVEEIGRHQKMAVIIDGFKFRLARIPYWGSLYRAFELKGCQYYPINDKDWHEFCDAGKAGDSPDRLDIKNVFLPRADAITPNI